MIAVLVAAIIGYLAKYILTNLEHRVGLVEQDAKEHSSKLSVAETKNVATEQTLHELRSEIGSVRGIVTDVRQELTELMTLMRQFAPPKR